MNDVIYRLKRDYSVGEGEFMSLAAYSKDYWVQVHIRPDYIGDRWPILAFEAIGSKLTKMGING